MHIILLILKILGFLVLAILGILLFLLLVLLFCPIRYMVRAEKEEELLVNTTLRFLGPVICVKAVYEAKQLTYWVNVFGITLFPRSQEKPKKAKKSKIQKSRKKVKKTEQSIEEDLEDTTKKSAILQEIDGEITEHTQNNETDEKSQEEFHSYEEHGQDSDLKKNSRWDKLRLTVQRLLRGKEQWNKFIKQAENRQGILAIWKFCRKTLSHIGPQVIKGRIVFGLDDPSRTGQILGLLSIFYGVYGRTLQIIPDFEQSILNGSVWIKGRVRIFSLLSYSLILILNHDFKRLWANVKQLKEAF